MTKHLRLVVCAQALVFASCSGGGGSLPIASHAVVQSLAVPSFVAVPLPANFVPQAMMRDGQVVGSIGSDAAIYVHSQAKDLGRLTGAASSTALWANSRGEAVGYSVFES